MDCLFCKIARKEITSNVIYENDAVFAFLDIHPRASGHTVVIPKEHAENILRLSNEATGPLFEGVKKVAELISAGINSDGFTIGVNHGRASGVEVDHLHIHVIPRFSGDKGKDIQSVVLSPSSESLEEIAKKIVKP